MRHTGICSFIVVLLSLSLLAACSRENADWKSASTADTIEAYQQFLQEHPKAANATAAQARLTVIDPLLAFLDASDPDRGSRLAGGFHGR